MALSDLHIDLNRLAALCPRYGIERLEIIGSFARGDSGPGSDVDVRIGLEFVKLKEELGALFGREEEEAPIVDGLPEGSKGIFNDQALDDLPVLQIFRQKSLCPPGQSRFDDQGVPE